jgi:hypothetical protein
MNIQDALLFIQELKKKLASFHTEPFASRFYVGIYTETILPPETFEFTTPSGIETETIQPKPIRNITYTDHHKRQRVWEGEIKFSWSVDYGERSLPKSEFDKVSDFGTTKERGKIKGNHTNNTTYDAKSTCPMFLKVTVPRPPPLLPASYCFYDGWVHDHKHLNITDNDFYIGINGAENTPKTETKHVLFVILDNVAMIIDFVITSDQYQSQYLYW